MRPERIYLLILSSVGSNYNQGKQQVKLLLSAGSHYIININPANAISISSLFSLLKAAELELEFMSGILYSSSEDIGSRPSTASASIGMGSISIKSIRKSIKNHKRPSNAAIQIHENEWRI